MAIRQTPADYWKAKMRVTQEPVTVASATVDESYVTYPQYQLPQINQGGLIIIGIVAVVGLIGLFALLGTNGKCRT